MLPSSCCRSALLLLQTAALLVQGWSFRAQDVNVRRAVLRRVRAVDSQHGPHLVARRDLNTEELLEQQAPLYKVLGGSSSGRGLPDHCQTCAIVGNAGTLKGSGLGNTIDAVDCVLRLGLAPAGGDYQLDAGSKTTVRIIQGNSLLDVSRRPERLTTGQLRSDAWILVGPSTDAVDPLTLAIKLRRHRRSSQVAVLVLTRAGEAEAKESFKTESARIGYQQPDKVPSTLWHSIRAAAHLGCNNTTVLGVPGPMFCKKHLNSHHGWTDSRYWGERAPPLCNKGKDSGSGSVTASDLVMSLADRRALKGWASIRQVAFMAPTWNSTES